MSSWMPWNLTSRRDTDNLEEDEDAVASTTVAFAAMSSTASSAAVASTAGASKDVVPFKTPSKPKKKAGSASIGGGGLINKTSKVGFNPDVAIAYDPEDVSADRRAATLSDLEKAANEDKADRRFLGEPPTPEESKQMDPYEALAFDGTTAGLGVAANNTATNESSQYQNPSLQAVNEDWAAKHDNSTPPLQNAKKPTAKDHHTSKPAATDHDNDSVNDKPKPFTPEDYGIIKEDWYKKRLDNAHRVPYLKPLVMGQDYFGPRKGDGKHVLLVPHNQDVLHQVLNGGDFHEEIGALHYERILEGKSATLRGKSDCLQRDICKKFDLKRLPDLLNTPELKDHLNRVKEAAKAAKKKESEASQLCADSPPPPTATQGGGAPEPETPEDKRILIKNLMNQNSKLIDTGVKAQDTAAKAQENMAIVARASEAAARATETAVRNNESLVRNNEALVGRCTAETSGTGTHAPSTPGAANSAIRTAQLVPPSATPGTGTVRPMHAIASAARPPRTGTPSRTNTNGPQDGILVRITKGEGKGVVGTVQYGNGKNGNGKKGFYVTTKKGKEYGSKYAGSLEWPIVPNTNQD